MAGVELPVEGEQRWIWFSPEDGGLPERLPLTIDFSTSFYFHREGPGIVFGGKEQTLEEVAEAGLRRLPLLADLPVQTSWWGYYEMSPDHNALVGAGGRAGGLLLRHRILRPRLPAGARGRRARGGADRGARADARPVGVRRRAVRARKRPARDVRRLGHRRPTGEALADVERRLAVHAGLAGQERHVLARAEGDHRVRVERRQRGARDLVRGRADDRQLARRREVQVERAERPAERGRDPAQVGVQRVAGRRPPGARARRRRRSARAAAARTRASSSATGPGCRRDPSCGRRAARRRAAVMEEAAALLVGEELDRQPGQPAAPPPASAARRWRRGARRARARRRRSPRGSPGSLARPFRHVR